MPSLACLDNFSLVLDSLLILDLGDDPDVLAFLMTVFTLAALSHLPPDTVYLYLVNSS